MKRSRIVVALALIAIVYIATLHQRATHAGGGSAGAVCTLSQTGCLKSMVLAEAIPSVIVASPSTPVLLEAPVDLFITCPVATSCGAQCTGGNFPTSASIGVALQEFSSQPHSLAPIASGAISTADNTMARPNFAPGGSGFNPYTIAVTIPTGTPPGFYSVAGTATVTFEDGMSLTATADQVVCLAEEAPGHHGHPRLDVQLLSEPFPRCAPGDQSAARYKITNNDPEKSVRLTAIATSRQIALRPKGGNESEGVFSIANPFGDDFPIDFNPGDCIPLPDHPYSQSEIHEQVQKIKPGRSRIIDVEIRPYGASATGSCCESSLRVEGTFFDGTAARACCGMAAYVDTSVASQNCGSSTYGNSVNDCNNNGVSDADDIANGTSQDRNFNGTPDECEQGAPLITAPVEVSPSDVEPGQPIHVRVFARDDRAVITVWANGVSLHSQDGNVWEGDIPSNSDAGPQTVFAMAEDADHKFATHIGVYATRLEGSDFRIEPSSAPQTISPGGSAEFVIAAKLLRGAGQPVMLSVEGLPNGATGSFSVNPVTPATGEGSQTVLTITTTLIAPSGSYSLTVVGTSGALRRETSVTLNLQGVFDYTLQAFNTPQTISPGDSRQFVIRATLLSGVAQPVMLSVEGLPDGATGSFSANPVTPAADAGSQATLTIFTGPNLPPGAYILNIVGTSPGLRHVASITLKVLDVDAFDFALGPSVSSVIIGVYAGGAEVDITVTAVGGTPEPVNLYAGGFPEGVSASFSQNPVIVTEGGEGKTTLTITPTSETVPLGDYQLIIVGTTGSVSRTVSIRLTITADPF